MAQTDIIDFITTARDILAADAAVKAWCQQAFFRDPAVYLGIDEDSPPEETEYPVIALVDVWSTAGASANRRTFEMAIGFGVVQENITTVGQVKTYDGVIQAEQFRELGELALLRGFNNPYMHFSGNTAKIDLYPRFVSFTTLALDEVRSRRHRRFT